VSIDYHQNKNKKKERKKERKKKKGRKEKRSAINVCDVSDFFPP